MHPSVRAIADSYKKSHTVGVKSGDTVRVHQKIKEGNKERIQVFEGLVIKVSNKDSLTARIFVRRSSGVVGVEKSYLLHSPLVEKVEITKRSKVRRNYLTYMRDRTGKSARLASIDFDKEAVNATPEIDNEKAQKEETEQAKPESKMDEKDELNSVASNEKKEEPKTTDEAKE